MEKETGDRIRAYELDGVKVDEDFKRYYPYDNLASKVLGFTGGDNQGIIGLEVKYENYLKGVNGMILTTTDARGIELADTLEDRVEPVSGDTLQVSLDYNIQEYAQQAAEKVMEEKQADAVVILILNPKTGEIYACVNAPEFDLNAPFTLPEGTDAALNDEEKQAMLNQMWRNRSINDTYEPGSIFKVFTASAALEEGVVKEEDTFYCPGYKLVEDRRIRCARTTGHGSETFVQGVQNSCNPVFIEVGMRLGTENFINILKIRIDGEDRCRSSGRGCNDHAQEGKCRAGRAGNDVVWTVFSGDTDADGNNSMFSGEWGGKDHSSFWHRRL